MTMEKSSMSEYDEEDDDDSSFDGTSSTGVTNSGSSNDAEKQFFGHSENRQVKNLKNLVFLVLFLVTLAVCLVIFFLTRKGQEDEFEAS